MPRASLPAGLARQTDKRSGTQLPAKHWRSAETRLALVAEKIKANQPAIILETEKTFATILEIQRELGKMLGALR